MTKWRRPCRRLCVSGLLLLAAGLVPVGTGFANTAAPESKTLSVIEQKLVFVSRFIERLGPDDRSEMLQRLEGLQERFLEGDTTDLIRDADTLLKEVMAAYKDGRKKAQPEQSADKLRYESRLRELNGFLESYDLAVLERVDAVEKDTLERDSFNRRVELAKGLAVERKYADAYSAIDGAYHQLISAVAHLRHNETVEYKLEFANSGEEYAYEKRRYASQRMLFDMYYAEKKPSAKTSERVLAELETAKQQHQAAAEAANKGDTDAALASEEAAVGSINKALRLLGVFF